jgi:hypothetical protein
MSHSKTKSNLKNSQVTNGEVNQMQTQIDISQR